METSSRAHSQSITPHDRAAKTSSNTMGYSCSLSRCPSNLGSSAGHHLGDEKSSVELQGGSDVPTAGDRIRRGIHQCPSRRHHDAYCVRLPACSETFCEIHRLHKRESRSTQRHYVDESSRQAGI